MKFFLSFIVLILIVSCSSKKEACTWSTAKKLNESDLKKCNADSSFYYMKAFSLPMNQLRKEKGIPPLPEDFTGVVWTVNNQVRWVNETVLNDTGFKKPFMKWKDLEWNKDTLKYDRTIFNLNDIAETYITVVYYQDSLSADKAYKFRYYLENKLISDSTIKKEQIDSILTANHLNY